MSQVTVFVDDAVRGRLPGVCAKDGVPTSDSMTVRCEVGDRAGLGVAWVLLLLGPLGWIGLLLIAVSRSGRAVVLVTRVPFSAPAYGRLRAARRLRRIAGAVALVTAPLGFLMVVAPSADADSAMRALALLVVATLVGAIAVLVVAERRMARASVQIHLDASRRWVTIHGVHPTFAAACASHEQRQGQRT
jgi:hypothetical protein